jgi:hypothetical protein
MTLIEVKPRKWGWCVFESPGVEPVFLQKDQALVTRRPAPGGSRWRRIESTSWRDFSETPRMKPNIPPVLITFALVCFALVQNTQAVNPPPDGGYPGGNTAEGSSALLSLTSGTYNTAIGIYSLLSLTDRSFCTGVGAGALLANTADQNTATGAGALLSNTTGAFNTANGTFALFANTVGVYNTALGASTLQSNHVGISNTAAGYQALYVNDSSGTGLGSYNSAFGAFALTNNSNGEANSAFGTGAMEFNSTGQDNVAVGTDALLSNLTGGGNTAIGTDALESSTGSDNTALGFAAGQSVTTANNVICIGSGVSGENVDNSCYIGNIYGAEISEFAAVVLVDADGKVGTGAVDANENKVTLPSPQTMLNELHKQQKRMAEFEATVTQQQSQIQALTAGLQKVTAQLEANKPAPQVVKNP